MAEEPRELRARADRLLDVARDRPVQLSPRRTRERGVRRLTDQRVLEGVLDVAGDRALGSPEHQPARLERVERVLDIRDRADRLHHAAPERVPDDRRVQDRIARLRRQRVDPGRDRGANRRWQLLGRGIVRHRRRELLDEQRVAAGRRHHPLDRVRRRVLQQRRDHLGGLVRQQGFERQRRVAGHACPPTRSRLQELGPREREEHDAVVPDVRDQVVDELEQCIVGPVQVLEHEQQGFALGQPFDQLPRRELQVDRVVGRLVQAQSQQQREVACGVVDLGHRQQRARERCELGPRRVGRLVVEDPRRAPNDLAGSQVRGGLLVGEAPAPQRAPVRGDDVGELAREPRLPDTRRPEHGYQMWPARTHRALPRRADQRQLLVAPDQRRVRDRPGARHGLSDQPRRHRLALALGHDRRELLVRERVSGQPPGLRVDDHATRGRRVLQARGRVHDVAGGERVLGRRVDRDHGLARAHGGADREVEPRMPKIELVDPLEHGARSGHGALGVVRARERRAEHGQHRVADVLLDGPAVLLDPAADLVVVELVPFADVLGIGAVGLLGRADHVDEQDRDELALLPRTGRREVEATARAETRPCRRFCTAARTGHETW